MTTNHHLPRGRVPYCAASPVGCLKPLSRIERTSDTMNIRTIAAAAALAIGATATPADAHRRPAGRNPQPELARQVIARYFPGYVRARAFRVVGCESGYDTAALNHNRNGTHDRGWWQLNDGGTMQGLGLTADEAFDPWKSTAAAYRLWKRRGWSPWVCSGRR